MRSYTKSVAISCAEAGLPIRVNSVHPGFVDTPLLSRAIDAAPDPGEARVALEVSFPRVGSAVHIGLLRPTEFSALQ